MEYLSEYKTRIHVQDMKSAINSLADNKSVTGLLEAQKNIDNALALFTNILFEVFGTRDAEAIARSELFCARLAECSMEIKELFSDVTFFHLCDENKE
jgi:hypothetical protein